MDGQRFDDLTRTAAGVSRRRALRLAGGGLAVALLAAVGRGQRVAAQGAEEGRPEFTHCVEGHPGPVFNSVVEGDPSDGDALPCGGGPNGCPQGSICAALVGPTGKLLCRCLRVDDPRLA